MNEFLIVVAVLGVVALLALIVQAFLRNADLKEEQAAVRYYKELWYEQCDATRQANHGKQELRQVLAASILSNHKNYLAIDPSTFEALPEDFGIFKEADTGSDGDHNILVYRVGPREVSGVKLQNAIL